MKPESRKIFFLTAVCCCSASIIISLLSLFGIDPAQYFPPVWLLHLGIFVVWIPSIAILRENMEKVKVPNPFSGKSRTTLAISLLIGSPPKRIKYIAIAVVVYGVIVFAMVANKVPNGSIDSINGIYTLNDHGKISLLTKDQFNSYSAARTGLFAAFWILFYTAGALFWSAKNDPELPLKDLTV